jgi:tetratricopeptide (TPR) repeat protein
VNAQPATCSNCGAKVSAGRSRCPRCRATLAVTDPVAAAAASRRLALIAAAMVGVFVLGVTVLWLTREPEPTPQAVNAGPAPDLFASRRPAPPPPAETPVVTPPATLERAFLDPPGTASIAYTSGDMASALQQYLAAVERNPADAESLSNLGQVLVRLNRSEEAIPYFERAIALIPNRWAYTFNLARALGAVGRWQDSVSAYRRAQALYPDDYATAFNLALALRKIDDHDGAVLQFQKAISLEPNDATFRIALGMTFERLQKPADAASAYEEALRLSPQAPDAEVVRGRIAKLRGGSGGD